VDKKYKFPYSTDRFSSWTWSFLRISLPTFYGLR